jgi:CheY-like chemotaxis protein
MKLMAVKTNREAMTILVVDDAPMHQKLIERILGKHVDARMIFASNGSEAVKIFMREPISLILMDMEMPVMDGYTAARYIRNLPNGKDVPIVAITANVGATERTRCLEAGCTAYIQKPFQKENLIGTTEEYLKNKITN